MMKQKQVTVIAGVVLRNGKVLMTQHFHKENEAAHLKWEFPGGKVEFGEAPADCVKRELLEETGIEVRVGKLLPFVYSGIWHVKDEKIHAIVFAYRCSYVRKVAKPSDHRVVQVAWIPINELKGLDRLPGTDGFLTAAIESLPNLSS